MIPPFPLRLTPIEHFFVLDDQPGYPNHIVCRLRLKGVIDREKWEQAILDWGPRHLMFHSRLIPGRRPSWGLERTDGQNIQWIEMPDGDDVPPVEPLDLVNGFPHRVLVIARPSSCDLILQTHHAVVDGVGGLRVIQELLQVYASQFDATIAKKCKLRPLNNDLLRHRGRYVTRVRDFMRALPPQVIGLYGAFKYVCRRATPLTTDEARSNKIDHQLHHLTEMFSQADSDRLRLAAQDHGATVNAILTRDLFLAIRDWQDHNDVKRAKRFIRLMIPINMRSIRDRRLGAANRVSIVYLDRNEKQMRDPGELLWGVNFEIKTVQRLNLGLTFLVMMKLVRMIPGQLKREVSADRCRSTAILTNLGDPFARTPLPRNEQGHLVAGDVSVESFDLFAPLRPLTAAAFSVFRYAGRTGVTLNYDANSLKRGQAEGLLRRYINYVSQSIAKLEEQASADAALQQDQAESTLH